MYCIFVGISFESSYTPHLVFKKDLSCRRWNLPKIRYKLWQGLKKISNHLIFHFTNLHETTIWDASSLSCEILLKSKTIYWPKKKKPKNYFIVFPPCQGLTKWFLWQVYGSLNANPAFTKEPTWTKPTTKKGMVTTFPDAHVIPFLFCYSFYSNYLWHIQEKFNFNSPPDFGG